MQQTDPWAAFNPQGGQQGGPVFGAPPLPKDPLDQQYKVGQIAGQERDAQKFTFDQGKFSYEQGKDAYDRSRQQTNDGVDNSTKLIQQFKADKTVQAYREVLPQIVNAMNAAPGGQGDLTVIYSWAKAMDPTGSVREGDTDLATSASSVSQQAEKLAAQVRSGNVLAPAVRQGLIEEMRNKGRQLDLQYSSVYRNFQDLARRSNLDPAVLGNHEGDLFRSEEEAYIRAHGGTPKYTTGPNANPEGGAPAPQNPLYQALADEYTKAGLPYEIGPDGKPELVLQGGAVGKPEQSPFLTGVGDLVEGAGDVLGLVANPLNAGINALTGSNLGTDFGQSLRDVTGLPDGGNKYAAAINQGGIGALAGTGLAMGAGKVFGGLAGQVAKQAAAEPVRQFAAGVGSGAAGQAAENANLGPVGQMAASFGGGLAGYAGVAGAASKLNVKPNALMQAAERQNVRLMPADVAGPETKNFAAAAAKAPLSAGPIIKGAKQTQADLRHAVGRAANAEGTPLAPDDAGEALRAPLKDYAAKQGSRIGKVYDRAEERAKGVKIKPRQAVAFLDEQIARFQQAPNGAPIAKDLASLKGQIEGGVSVSGMRDARTILSQGVYDGKLRSPMQKGIYKQFLKALSGDIEGGLTAAGRKDALNLFRVADKAWSERIDYIDGVLEPVIGGNKSGEDILKAVEGMARGHKGGVARLVEVMREMPPEQAQNVRATIIERMGDSVPSQQDADGSSFSSQTFLTNWNKMSGKGKAALFGDSELRRNLNDIAQLSSAVRESAKYANSSNTAGGIWGNVGALGGIATVSPKFAIVAGVLQHSTGRLLASRSFTRWLARMPENPQAQTRHAQQLGQIAAREPIIANDLGSIQNFLASGSQRAAASPEDQQ